MKTPSEIQFRKNFTKKHLQIIFDNKISAKENTGIDGLHAHDLNQKKTFEIIRKKVIAGTYHFTPYAEIQISKGRGKSPRIIALPTVRDQVVLSALKDYLHDIFPVAVNHKLANSNIFELNKEIQKVKRNGLHYGFIHTDISGFYDNIDREKLMNFIRNIIDTPQALKLIYRAIVNPTVPRNSKRSQRFRYYSPKGVPQGLAISNVLAGIYMSKLDQIIESSSSYFIRYVDDILLLCPIEELSRAIERLHFEISKLGLELNEEKTKTGIIGKDTFNFLGYKINSSGLIGVKDNSVHRKISSLASKISSADHRKDSFLKLHNITKKTYRKVLVEDINELITGAISDSKRYGWIFYFSQINDIALLHRLDRIVEKLCKRCHTFSKRKPKKIKSFVIAYREIHKLLPNIESSYIPSYDNWKVREQIDFLNDRGLLIEGKKYTGPQIGRLFKITLRKRLLSLEKDVKNMS